MPDGRHLIEVPVHDANRLRTEQRRDAVNVALTYGRQKDCIANVTGVVDGERGSDKYAKAHSGRPRAARAVGSAGGANPIAYLVPCHRVIRKSGALGGYHWGLGRKLAMLTEELN